MDNAVIGAIIFPSYELRPPLEYKEGGSGFMNLKSLTSGAFYTTLTKLGYSVINKPLHLVGLVHTEDEGFHQWIVGLTAVRVKP